MHHMSFGIVGRLVGPALTGDGRVLICHILKTAVILLCGFSRVTLRSACALGAPGSLDAVQPNWGWIRLSRGRTRISPTRGKFRLISDFKLRINCFGVYSEKMPSGGDIVSEISPIYNGCC